MTGAEKLLFIFSFINFHALGNKTMSCYITFGGYRNRKRLTKSVIEWFIHNRKLSRFQTFVHVIDRNLKREGMYGCIHSIDQLSRPRFFEIEMCNQQDDNTM